MIRMTFAGFILLLWAVLTLTAPSAVSAQAESGITMTALDSQTFVTVKETAKGDLLSLYKVRGDTIILLDMVINSTAQSDMRLKLPTRYLHRLEVENK